MRAYSAAVVGVTVVFGALSLAAGCSSGSALGASDGGLIGTPEGGTSDSSASFCTELHIGGQNDPGIGGPAPAQVAAQAISDYAGAVDTQLAGVTTACKSLATGLGATSAAQATADAETDALRKANAWCTLATATIGTAKEKVAGFISVDAPPSSCKLSVADKLACQARCAGMATCDGVANPASCTGGTLADGFCTGGKLEGGCKVDAKCEGNCNVSVIAAAACSEPVVNVTVDGTSDAAAAATLESTVKASFPSLLALSAHLKLEAEVASAASGNADALVDIKSACIPPAVAAAAEAVAKMSAAVSAAGNPIGALQN